MTAPLILLILGLFVSCTQSPVSDEAKITSPQEVMKDTSASETLTIDSSQSKIEWVGTKVTGYHIGLLKIKNGKLKVKAGKVTGGSFVIDMNSLNVTGPLGSRQDANEKLQQHLLSADFFETGTYPEATFVITDVKPFTGMVKEEEKDPRQEEISRYKVSAPSHLVSGNLTIKGITKNIQFPARITVTGSYADALAKFNIDRTLWNITYPGKPDDLIRNEIHLGIALLATQNENQE